MRLALVCFYCLCVFVYVLYFIATMSFAGYFLPVLFCMLSMLISDSRFDLVWFRLSCDHGWIRSGSVNVRKQQQKNNNNNCTSNVRELEARRDPGSSTQLLTGAGLYGTPSNVSECHYTKDHVSRLDHHASRLDHRAHCTFFTLYNVVSNPRIEFGFPFFVCVSPVVQSPLLPLLFFSGCFRAPSVS